MDESSRPNPVALERALWDAAITLSALLDPQGLIREANAPLLARLGRTGEDVHGRAITFLLPPEHHAEAQAVLSRAAETASCPFSFPLHTRSGEDVPIHGQLIRFQSGQEPGLLLACHERCKDIFPGFTVLQRDLGVALSATSVLHEALRLVLDASMRAANMDSGGVYLLDEDAASLRLEYQVGLPDGFAALVQVFEASSPQMQRWREGQAIYTRYQELMASSRTPEPAAAIAAGLRSLASIPLFDGRDLLGCLNLASRTDDGVSQHARMSLETIASQFANAIVRIRAEDALVQLSNRFRALVQKSSDVVGLLDRERTLRYTTPAFQRMTGFESEAFAPGFLRSILHPEDAPRHDALMQELTQTPGSSFSHEARFQIRHGDWKHIAYHVTNLLEDPELEAIVINAWDVTEQRVLAEALRAERDLVRSLFEASPIPVAFVSPEGIITDCNQAGVRELGGASKDDLVGRMIRQFATPSSHAVALELLNRALKGEVVRNAELTVCNVQGMEFDAELSGSVLRDRDQRLLGLVVMIQNVSERKRIEEELRQTQKMESIGRLAGGVAHDFNNLLTAIKGFASLARAEAGDNNRVVRDVDAVLMAASRAEKLTGELLAFSRHQILRPVRISLNALLRELAGTLKTLLGDHIVLDLVLDPDSPTIEADRRQIENLVVNLCVNARDALPNGGTVTVETDSHAKAPALPTRQDVVRLSIQDTGSGIDDTMLPYVFEPFFTSKATGSGTGLGLATVYGIVKQHKGHIRVGSDPGAGTRFDVYLPRIDAQPDAEAEPQPSLLQAMPRGNETVLVVDDEKQVREIMVRVLQGLGYRVLEADGGDPALALLRRYQGEIHMLLTDVVMPEMGGKELAERVQATRPLIKVLYTSGYTRDAIVHQGVLDRGILFLSKPFTPDALAAKVRSVLDS